ncbi:unnamed protein product [Ranitomeya imitator]|uniref:FAD dependent oxidoreductase domain-containing protein n=1 Tax=Ranitomeya imitator TaxID=111125 RepID=A0ABN9LNC4_9NEOB|nr:unnamed protein product [Ranitomeya imitator]
MVRLAEYSRDCLKALRQQTGIQYEGRQKGTLQLFRTEQQFANAAKDIQVLEDAESPISFCIPMNYKHQPLPCLMKPIKLLSRVFDNRIRVGGMAEVVGFNRELKPARRETLEMVVEDLYPNAGELTQAAFWTGLRPMTPDGTPIVGATGFKNLWVNTGHGTLGWTMACGSARLLSDLIANKTPDIAFTDLNLSRYSR